MPLYRGLDAKLVCRPVSGESRSQRQPAGVCMPPRRSGSLWRRGHRGRSSSAPTGRSRRPGPDQPVGPAFPGAMGRHAPRRWPPVPPRRLARRCPSTLCGRSLLELSGESPGRPGVLGPEEHAGDGAVEPVHDPHISRRGIGRGQVRGEPLVPASVRSGGAHEPWVNCPAGFTSARQCSSS